MRRVLSPTLNPTGIGSAVAAIYAAAVMIWNATHHHGVIDPQVIVAAIAAAAFLYSRFLVTPTADPRDGARRPLVPAPVTTVPPVTTVTEVTPTGTVTVIPPEPGEQP